MSVLRLNPHSLAAYFPVPRPDGDLRDREDWQSMLSGAQAFNRRVARLHAAHPRRSLDAIKEEVWSQLRIAPPPRKRGARLGSAA